MNLAPLRDRFLEWIHALQSSGQPTGAYRIEPGSDPDLYGSCDAAISLAIMGVELDNTFTFTQRNEWAAFINQFAQDDGTYEGGRHCREHRNGTVIGALGILSGRQPRPVSFYSDYAGQALIAPWMDALDWPNQWAASHLFWGGPLMFSFSAKCPESWKQEMLQWLNRGLDPDTGWWHRLHSDTDCRQPIGGAAHIWPFYQHHGFPFPYPERVIDSILALQKPDGTWLHFGNYLDLDALYGLRFMQSFVPNYRKDDVRSAVERHAVRAEAELEPRLAEKPELHLLMGIIGSLGLLNQHLPERFPDDRPWSDIFSDPRFYQTARVEAV